MQSSKASFFKGISITITAGLAYVIFSPAFNLVRSLPRSTPPGAEQSQSECNSARNIGWCRNPATKPCRTMRAHSDAQRRWPMVSVPSGADLGFGHQCLCLCCCRLSTTSGTSCRRACPTSLCTPVSAPLHSFQRHQPPADARHAFGAAWTITLCEGCKCCVLILCLCCLRSLLLLLHVLLRLRLRAEHHLAVQAPGANCRFPPQPPC